MFSSMLIDKNSPYCPGCGHQAVSVGLAKALEAMNYNPLDVILVSDIGCCGLIDPLFACHTIHGLHGRACALASGLSMSIDNPDKKVIAIQGDGGATIGIAHLLEAARRNFNLTLIVSNNMIYGMTGGQFSGLSNQQFQCERHMEDSAIRPFDIVDIANKAGAASARRIIGKGDIADKLKETISLKGFSLIEILEVCPSYGVQKYSDIENFGYLEKSFVNPSQFFTLPKRETKSLVSFDSTETGMEFKHSLSKKIKIILAGSAGEGVQSAAELLAKAAIYAGLQVSKKGDYPITVGTGFSIAELIFSPAEIHFTGITEPDYAIVVSQNGFEYIKTRIGADTKVMIDNSINTELKEEYFHHDLKSISGKKNVVIASIGLWLLMNNIIPFEAFEKAIKESKHGDKFSVVMESVKRVFTEIQVPSLQK